MCQQTMQAMFEVDSEVTKPLCAKQPPPTEAIALNARLIAFFKSAAVLAVVLLLIPLVTVLTAASALFHFIQREVLNLSPGLDKGAGLSASVTGETAIVTGGKMTKALHTCRHLKAQGCRVVLVETSKYWMVAARFSNCVDRFCVVPIPQNDPVAYQQAIKKIAEEEGATIFIPTSAPIASEYDASVREVLPANCKAYTPTLQEVRLLDNKDVFCKLAGMQGLSVPKSQTVRTHEEVLRVNRTLQEGKLEDNFGVDAGPTGNRRFLLKSIAYDSMHRLDCFTIPCPEPKLKAYLDRIPLSEDNPWVVQQFCSGEELSSWAVCRDGKMLCFATTRACMSCYNWQAEPRDSPMHQEIQQWLEKFVCLNNLTGNICVDFMNDGPGTPVMAIECNPRTSSIIATFHDHPELGQVYLQDSDESKQMLLPLDNSPSVYWLFHELFSLAFRGNKKATLKHLMEGTDAYLSPQDPLPFFMLHALHLPVLLLRNMRVGGNPWSKIDLCIGKLTEVNGD